MNKFLVCSLSCANVRCGFGATCVEDKENCRVKCGKILKKKILMLSNREVLFNLGDALKHVF